MLVVVSDLHLQHVSLEAVRYVSAGQVRENGVRRNVTPGALQMLFADIHAFSERAFAREVEIVFAGDIFELLRSPLWFAHGDAVVCPTNRDLGPDSPDNRLRGKVHEVLDAIVKDNQSFFEVLHRFVQEGSYEYNGRALALPAEVKVRAHYIPGNHDRLANAWPSVRRRVRELLAMDPASDPFPHAIERPKASGYGVRIRHGHEYDSSNIGVTVPFGQPIALSEADYLAPCLGDYVTLEIALRLSVAFRTLYAKALHADNDWGRELRGFYGALVEFDDVRPPTLLVTYLAKQLGKRGQRPFELLRPVLLDLYFTAVASPFVQDMAQRLALVRYVSDPLLTMVREAIRKLSPASLESLIKRAQAMDTSHDTTRSAVMASFEAGLSCGDFDAIIAGHTHHPDVLPILSTEDREREVFYLDTGTWRTSIRHGVSGAFGRVRACTVVFCYSDDERVRSSNTRRFETWTGHLAATSFGPYDIALGPLAPARRRLRWTAVRILHIDEGDTRDGAELRVSLGVDGQERIFERRGVRNGDRIEVNLDPMDLYTQLDGGLVAFGSEIDLGDQSLFDGDDPLPWALLYLPRDAAGDFVVGKGKLPMRRYGDTPVIIDYEVIAID